MSAWMLRSFVLACDGRWPASEVPSPLVTTASAEAALRCMSRFRGDMDETRAATRGRAAKNGWTHVRTAVRSLDEDYCPHHKPAGESDGQPEAAQAQA